MHKKNILKSIVAGLFLLVVSVPLVSADENVPTPENMFNIYRVITEPFTRLFEPLPEIFWVIMLVVINVGVYIKTNSVGAVTATLAILSVLLSALVSPFEWVFRIIAGVSFVWLLWWTFKEK